MKQRTDNRAVMHFLLSLLAAGAVLPLAAMAPNAVGPIMRLLRQRDIHPHKARAVIHYLKRHQLVILREEKNETAAEITASGKRKLIRLEFDNLTIPIPKRWDRHWRLVAFDIPEKRRTAREALRKKLQELEFLPIQRSVWVHPFAGADEVNFIAEVLQVSPYLWLAETVQIDHEDYLKKKFNLA